MMLEHFTSSARSVLVLAKEEADTLGHNRIGSEHLLLGMIREGKGLAAEVLVSAGVSLQDVRQKVPELASQHEEVPPNPVTFTPRARKVLELSRPEAFQLGHTYVSTEHILLGLIQEGEGVAAQVLVALGVELNGLREEVLRRSPPADPGTTQGEEAGSVVLDQFCENLTQAARHNKLDPVVGRDREIDEVIQVLSRRTKSNPVLIGEPGVGKSAIVDGLAEAIVRGDVPPSIRGKLVYKLDVEKLTSSGNTIATNLQSIFAEVDTRADIILFIDEIHTLVGESSLVGPNDLAKRMVPILNKGYFRIVGASTLDDYREHIEPITLLHQLLTQVTVKELSIPHAIESLKIDRDRLEAHYRMSITDSALAAAAILARRYLRNQVLPESAIALLDGAGARLNLRRTTPPPHLKALDERIAAIKKEKELAIDAQDFEGAAAVRDREQKLIAERLEKENIWKLSDFYEPIELDENAIVEVVALESGVPIKQVLDTLGPRRQQQGPLQGETRSYILLGDQPAKETNEDLLGAAASAEKLAAIISDSRSSSPFVMAIDGGWGMGKSTLLHQIASRLSRESDVKIVHFNAWTSQGERALEGLIKSVLASLDKNSLRRGLRKVSERRLTMKFFLIFLGALARLVGATRLIDEIWNQLAVDAKGRNELRAAIFDMLSDWKQKGEGVAGKSLVVFIDDLDRCSDQVIVQICEAVKLYLNAPGLIFIIGCDYSVLRRGVSASDRGNEARIYLEKIIQVVHRIQPSNEEQLLRLIRGYANISGTAAVIDPTVEDILSKRAGHNPRRIKRIFNSFVLESRLKAVWSSPELGYDQLIKAIIFHHLYPGFYDELVSDQSGEDPIGDFLDYAEVKGRAADPPPLNDAWWSTTSKLFRRHDMSPPRRSTTERSGLLAAIANLEAGLPDEYPDLARDMAFVSLLKGVGDDQARAALTSLLRNEPLQTETFADVGDTAALSTN